MGQGSESSAKVMGILNVTPDSFSDGGRWTSPVSAVKYCHTMLRDGAAYIDVGAESTRPGADYISDEEEWGRLSPTLITLLEAGIPKTKLCIDTRRESIVTRAMEMGVVNFNCVTGYYQKQTLREIFRVGGTVCAMHMHRHPKNMQQQPLDSTQVVSAVEAFFEGCVETFVDAGAEAGQYFLDPGVGFGKTQAANLRLIDQASIWSQKFPLLYGVSRKSFIGNLFGIKQPGSRDAPTKLIEKTLIDVGVQMIRTHNVSKLNELQNRQFTRVT